MFEEFSPPDEGLNLGEEVVWNRRAGMAAMMMLSGACCILNKGPCILISSISMGPLITNILVIVFFIGIFLTIVEFVNSRRTKYYLTTERLVEVRGGLIRTQIPLSHFKEAGTADFLEIKSTYSEGAKTFYQAKIRDPTSGKMMVLTGLDEDARALIQKIAD